MLGRGVQSADTFWAHTTYFFVGTLAFLDILLKHRGLWMLITWTVVHRLFDVLAVFLGGLGPGGIGSGRDRDPSGHVRACVCVR